MQINNTLYKQTKLGAVQQWSVFVTGNVIIVEQGQVEGKLQSYSTECSGKNIGKANESTPEEQAVLEAKAKWTKQIKKGYTEDESGVITVELPQKVKNYFGNESNVIFPCAASYKLNGVNAEYVRDDSGLWLKSRGGDKYPMIEHHVKPVENLMDLLGVNNLSGELYKHGEWLQDITSAVKKPNELTNSLKFHMFDIPKHEGTYTERRDLLEEGYKLILNTHLHIVPTLLVNNTKELKWFHERAVHLGFEGIVINNLRGVHKYNERSSDIFKMKLAIDAEFKIINYKLDKNNQVVFECLVGNSDHEATFWVKPKGSKEQREVIRKDVNDWVNNWLKVEFESYSKDGVPTKPVGICLRDCDSDGQPLE